MVSSKKSVANHKLGQEVGLFSETLKDGSKLREPGS